MPDLTQVIAAHRAQLGPKPDPVSTGRAAECKRLTVLMLQQRAFSLTRIGDYDAGFLLDPHGAAEVYGQAHEKISGTEAYGSPGLTPELALRLRTALEQSAYLDFHERLWTDNSLIESLDIRRPAGSFRNPDRATSYILPTWLEYEFKNFCKGRRVLFCGAEAPLLESLLKRPAFTECAHEFWPDDCEAYFLTPRDFGRNLGTNLELIKQDILAAIRRWQIKFLFVSLGGAAKILCHEIAQETGVCTIDFGACLRSLCYSGSDGDLPSRSTHMVFLYRVPFELYMEAVQEAYQHLTPEQLLAKAHAQLILEVQQKERGWPHSAWEFDFSQENVTNFYRSLEPYKQRFRRLFDNSTTAKHERAGFLHFCGKNRLTAEGRFFYAKFRAKDFVRRRFVSHLFP